MLSLQRFPFNARTAAVMSSPVRERHVFTSLAQHFDFFDFFEISSLSRFGREEALSHQEPDCVMVLGRKGARHGTRLGSWVRPSSKTPIPPALEAKPDIVLAT
jgi:hypothetical protein